MKKPLHQFVEAAESLWQLYLQLGPGKLTVSDHDQVAATFTLAIESVDESDDSLSADVKLIRELTRRCACRPEGLCFITGEAGLIPRREQHQALEDALASLRRSIQTDQEQQT